jgi:hypothetical protein
MDLRQTKLEDYISMPYEDRLALRVANEPGQVANLMSTLAIVNVFLPLIKSVMSLDGHNAESKKLVSEAVTAMQDVVRTVAANSTGDPRALDEALKILTGSPGSAS